MRGLKRSRLIGMLGAGTAWGIAGLATAQGLAPLRIGMALTDGITLILYGLQAGMFAAAGLDVQLTVGTSGAAMSAAVVGGSLDIAASSLMPLLAGHARGVPLRIVAGSTVYNPAAPSGEIAVLKSSHITSMADMNGATVALTTLHALDELGLRALVDGAGGSSATLKFIETPGSLLLSALERQRADVASFSEPTLSTALASGELRTLGDPNAGIDSHGLLIAAFICTPTFFEQNRELLGRFTSALYRATKYTNSHHAQTVPLLAQYAHMDPDVIKRMTRQTLATSLDVRMIQPAIDVAAKYKFIDGWFDARDLLA